MKKIRLTAVAVLAAASLVIPTVSQAATVDSKAAALLPAKIAKAGTINVGIDATYPPNEYKDAAGKPIGWEVDLFNAVAAKLGLKVNYVIATFDNILPAVKGGKYDVGVSSFTDTKEREANFDFANYYSAGIQWATQKGKKVDPNNACGLIVGIQTGSTEVDDVKAKSDACVKAGKKPITIKTYDAQTQVTNALVLGSVNAMSADSPITGDAVAKTKGKLVLAGEIYGAAPYGYPVAKGSTLAKALSAALTSINADGTYKKILTKWGVQSGAITKFTINGATE